MNRLFLFIILVGTISLVRCTKKTIPSDTSQKVHVEDLSVFRPEIPVYNEIVKDSVELEPAHSYAEASNLDITRELNILLDSISKVNIKREYYEYTVLVHIGNNREEADEARLNVIRLLPEMKPKLEYKSPSYRVKVGRYFNNVEAYQTYVKLKEQFPKAIIVPERVYFR